jgi:hypothetical protein
MVWLKKRKRSKQSKGPEDPHVGVSPTEEIRVTPFTPLASERRHPVDYKGRPVQEITRPLSPETSIGTTGTGSQISVVPVMEARSEEPYSVASTSDPFRRLPVKDPGL